MCNHNNGCSTYKFDVHGDGGFFSPRKGSFPLSIHTKNPFSSTFDLFSKYLALGPLINKFPIPIIGRKFRISRYYSLTPFRRREREGEKLDGRERERGGRGRKKKEEGTAHKYLCSPRCIDIIHGYRSSGGGNAFSLAAIRLSPRLEDADRFVQPVASPLTSTLRVLLHRFDERLPYPPLGVASENRKKRKRPRGTEIDTRSAPTILGSRTTGCLRNRGAKRVQKKRERSNTL